MQTEREKEREREKRVSAVCRVGAGLMAERENWNTGRSNCEEIRRRKKA